MLISAQYGMVARCAVHIEDCEGWWLSSGLCSVVEHWRLNPRVFSATASIQFFPHTIRHAFIRCFKQSTLYKHTAKSSDVNCRLTPNLTNQYSLCVLSSEPFGVMYKAKYCVLVFGGSGHLLLKLAKFGRVFANTVGRK